MNEDIVFEINDKSGRKIYLSEERWGHIKYEHPVVANRLEEIKDTLTNPTAVRKSDHDEKIRFYYRYYKNIKLREKYLFVMVRYLNGDGFVITSFYINKIKDAK